MRYLMTMMSLMVALAALAEKPEGSEEEKKTVPYIGISEQRISGEARVHLDIPDGMGRTISYVEPGGPADEAGIQKYDILLKFDDQWVVNSQQLRVLVRSHEPGEEVTLQVLRKGQEKEFEVTLGEREVKERKRRGFPFNLPGVPQPPDAPTLPDAPETPEDGDSQSYMYETDEDGMIVRTDDGGIYIDMRQLSTNLEQLGERMEMLGEEMENIEVEKILQDMGVIGERSTIIRMGEKEMFYQGDEGMLKVETREGERYLKAVGEDGEVLFNDKLPEDRSSLPKDVRKMLERLEDTQNMDFDLDEAVEIHIEDETVEEEVRSQPAIDPDTHA